MFYNTPASMIEKKSYRWRISFSTFSGSNSDLDKIWIFASKVKKPSMKIDTSQKKIHNTYTVNYPKIPTWNPIDMTFVDFRLAEDVDPDGNIIGVAGSKIAYAPQTYTSTDSYDIQIKTFNNNKKPEPIPDAGVDMVNYSRAYSLNPENAINLTENTDKDVYISAQTIFYQYLLKNGYNLNSKTVNEGTIFNSLLFKDTSISHINIYELDNDGIPIEKWIVNNPTITSVDFGNLDYATDQLMTVSVGFTYDYAELESLNLRESAIQKNKETRELLRSQKLADTSLKTIKLSEEAGFRKQGGDISTLVSKANELQADFSNTGSIEVADYQNLANIFGVSSDTEVSRDINALKTDYADSSAVLEDLQSQEEVQAATIIREQARTELNENNASALKEFDRQFSNIDLRDTPGYDTMGDVRKAESSFISSARAQQIETITELDKELSGAESTEGKAQRVAASTEARDIATKGTERLVIEKSIVNQEIMVREEKQVEDKLRMYKSDAVFGLDNLSGYGTGEGQYKNKQSLVKDSDSVIDEYYKRSYREMQDLQKTFSGDDASEAEKLTEAKLLGTLNAGKEVLGQSILDRRSSELTERRETLERQLTGKAFEKEEQYSEGLTKLREEHPTAITDKEFFSALSQNAKNEDAIVSTTLNNYGLEDTRTTSQRLAGQAEHYQEHIEEILREEQLFKDRSEGGNLFVGPPTPPPAPTPVRTPIASVEPPPALITGGELDRRMGLADTSREDMDRRMGLVASEEQQTQNTSNNSVIQQFWNFFGSSGN